jgi:hypothetical protein
LCLAEIGGLTPYQVSEIYFHARDCAGNVIVPARRGSTYRELFFDVWRRRALPDWRIQEKWQELRETQRG